MLEVSQEAIEALEIEAAKAGISVECLVELIVRRQAVADMRRALEAAERRIFADDDPPDSNVVAFRRKN